MPNPSCLPSMISSFSVVDAGIFILAVFLAWKMLHRKSFPLPPGPKGYPVIGSLLDFPTSQPWLTFAEWSKLWGPVMSVNVMGQLFVIVDEPDVAVELFDRRGSTYADRPVMPMAALCGWDRVLSSSRFGPRLREYRKLIGRVIGTKGSMVKFYPVEEYQSTMLLKRALQNPTQPSNPDRVCPGTHLADVSIWINVVKSIAGFQVSPTIGPDGKPIIPSVETVGDVIARPKPFICDVKPRTPQVPKIVAEYLATHDA
ncbi:cytochrome P450 [Auriscalpium vulgare]|uniref:Cytochrome P450 n=1 Tax=Auriscalpium vulgare TaxID=40419 RepID=A0ACB8RE20_9AGAM|nr:cytochrome P450 [Auriscalpium vulgare]